MTVTGRTNERQPNDFSGRARWKKVFDFPQRAIFTRKGGIINGERGGGSTKLQGHDSIHLWDHCCQSLVLKAKWISVESRPLSLCRGRIALGLPPIRSVGCFMSLLFCPPPIHCCRQTDKRLPREHQTSLPFRACPPRRPCCFVRIGF